jgi:hypothetical protein
MGDVPVDRWLHVPRKHLEGDGRSPALRRERLQNFDGPRDVKAVVMLLANVDHLFRGQNLNPVFEAYGPPGCGLQDLPFKEGLNRLRSRLFLCGQLHC